MPGVVLYGKTGILVEPKNIEQLACAIMKLIKNPNLRMEMGQAGRKFLLDNYDFKINVEQFEELYKNLA